MKGKTRTRLAVITAIVLVSICFFCVAGTAVMDVLGELSVPVQSTSQVEVPATIPPTEVPAPTGTPRLTPEIPFTATPGIPALNEAQCVPTGTEISLAEVTRVIDGDTIDVRMAEEIYRVRYIGMDTPETYGGMEHYGPQATEKNRELVEGKTILLAKDVSETDRYNRLLRYVFADGLFVNYELVRQGYATVTTFPPDVSCEATYLEAERFARENGLGLWAPEP